MIGLEALPDGFQTELIQTAEGVWDMDKQRLSQDRHRTNCDQEGPSGVPLDEEAIGRSRW